VQPDAYPLARLIEGELRGLARVLARLTAHELRLLLAEAPEVSPSTSGGGPACRVCGRPAQEGRHVCRRCRRRGQQERDRERQQAQAELAAAAAAGKRGPSAAELAASRRRDPARVVVGEPGA
jgi:hypothetical protein